MLESKSVYTVEPALGTRIDTTEGVPYNLLTGEKITPIEDKTTQSVYIRVPINLGHPLTNNRKGKTLLRLSRLVCYTANKGTISDPKELRLRQAIHKDGNWLNNRADNLKWGFGYEIMQQKKLTGELPTKLVSHVNEIRALLNSGYSDNIYEIAKAYGVHVSTIRAIKTNKSRKFLPFKHIWDQDINVFRLEKLHGEIKSWQRHVEKFDSFYKSTDVRNTVA